MCGGNLEIDQNMSVGVCEYCGTEQTLPKTDDEQLISMLNRANHFRQQCEFDRAMDIYEKVVVNNENVAEVYWSMVLCRFGIEYVDDPATGKKIPTCHRTQFKSILDDQDYHSALNHADSVQRGLFEEEARYIDLVQKSILEISNKEEPFDVFICYKESDDNGTRTKDSALAQDIYYQLVEKGYKVFFARITLEDKLGAKYEPYIFAALNSAKVMIVVGTKPEYFKAVWVKNEWSRYLAIMQTDKKKVIIPAYRDMDPYDLPDELSYFQALDMSKIGFMQDLVRGIVKVIEINEDSQGSNSNNTGSADAPATSNVDALLKRGYMSLEDKDWELAVQYFEQVLNQDAESAKSYLGLVYAKNKCFDSEELCKLRLKNTENADQEKHIAKLDESDYAYIVNDLREHGLENAEAVANDLLNCQVVYYTTEECRKKQLEEEKRYYSEDRYFKRVFQFADQKTESELDNVKKSVLGEMEQRISVAKENDINAEREAKRELLSYLDMYYEMINTKKNLKGQRNEGVGEDPIMSEKQEYNEMRRKSDELIDRINNLPFWEKKKKELLLRELNQINEKRNKLYDYICNEEKERKKLMQSEQQRIEEALNEDKKKYYQLSSKWDWIIKGRLLSEYNIGNNTETLKAQLSKLSTVKEMADYIESTGLKDTTELYSRLYQELRNMQEFERMYGNRRNEAIKRIENIL